MNNLKRNFFGLLLATSFLASAQENQIIESENFGSNLVTSYTISSCCSERLSFTFSEYDGKKSVAVLEDGSTRDPKTYFVDEEAFPVTFIKGQKNGNKEQQERLKVLRFYKEERIVFLGDWVYELDNWKSKDSYSIVGIYFNEDIRGLKSVKAAAGANKKMKAANHEEVLQNYLDQAFAKQEEALKTWNVENADLVKRRIDNKQILTDEINKKNADYWASEEGQAIIERNKKADANKAQNAKGEVKLIYRGSGTVKFGYERNSWGSVLGAGQSTTLECDKDIYIYRTEGTTTKRAEKVNSAGSNCGGSVEVK